MKPQQLVSPHRLLRVFSCLLFAASPPLKALSGSKVLPEKAQYAVKRALDAWKYGSGADFKL